MYWLGFEVITLSWSLRVLFRKSGCWVASRCRCRCSVLLACLRGNYLGILGSVVAKIPPNLVVVIQSYHSAKNAVLTLKSAWRHGMAALHLAFGHVKSGLISRRSKLSLYLDCVSLGDSFLTTLVSFQSSCITPLGLPYDLFSLPWHWVAPLAHMAH